MCHLQYSSTRVIYLAVSCSARRMSTKRRKTVMVRQSNEAPTWQRRISSFFISPAADADSSERQPPSTEAGPNNVCAEAPGNGKAAAPAQDSLSVDLKAKFVIPRLMIQPHMYTPKDGPTRAERPFLTSSKIVDPDEPYGKDPTEPNVPKFATAELGTAFESASTSVHAVDLEGEHAVLDPKEPLTIKGDVNNDTFKLLMKRSRFSGERKDDRSPTEPTFVGPTSGAVEMDSLNVLPWPLKSLSPRGHYMVESFITVEEEEHLLHCLDNDLYNPWKISRVNGMHMGKAFGVISVRRSFTDQTQLPPMPKFVKPYVERMRNQVPVLKDFFPNEMNAIDYRKSEGHWLKAHMDDRQLSGTILVNLSLGGTCIMTYAQERGAGDVHRVTLGPRSLQILTGESRYNFTHGIQKDDFLSPRRSKMYSLYDYCSS